MGNEKDKKGNTNFIFDNENFEKHYVLVESISMMIE